MRIIIDGQPIPKMRPRHKILKLKKFTSKKMPKMMSYDPQSLEKKRVSDLMLDAYHEFRISNTRELTHIVNAKSLIVFITFYFQPPKSTIIEYNRKLWNFEPHTKKPDVDNLGKFYLDCGNGILWDDDTIISSLYLRKLYSETPHTEIFIMPKDDISISDKNKQIIECFSPEELQKFLKEAKKLGNLLDCEISLEDPDSAFENIAQSILFFAVSSESMIKKIAKIGKS